MSPLDLLRRRTPATEDQRFARGSVAVLGLGYVGLPTALSLHQERFPIIGIDLSERRMAQIRCNTADLLDRDRARLSDALDSETFALTGNEAALSQADAVIICVPTPVHHDGQPDLTFVTRACAAAVMHARPGQTIVLTSTTYAGTTRDLLAGPLSARGLEPGRDIFVAFSPERINPGDDAHAQDTVPRVLGGVTPACATKAFPVVAAASSKIHVVSSPEAAELTKLYENTFRAVNVALANEMATNAKRLGIDPIEVTEAAATKPYGFMAHWPGAGVGGHCIPCDPHYLLWQLREAGYGSPLIAEAMRSIARRPHEVVARAEEILAADGLNLRGAKVLVNGVAYKPGVEDLRESPALTIYEGLRAGGADVAFHDPLCPEMVDADGNVVDSVDPRAFAADLVVSITLHPGADYTWLWDAPRVLDTTYRQQAAVRRYTV